MHNTSNADTNAAFYFLEEQNTYQHIQRYITWLSHHSIYCTKNELYISQTKSSVVFLCTAFCFLRQDINHFINYLQETAYTHTHIYLYIYTQSTILQKMTVLTLYCWIFRKIYMWIICYVKYIIPPNLYFHDSDIIHTHKN